MKISDITEGTIKDISNNVVYFPINWLVNELGIPNPNCDREKFKLVDNRIKGYWLKNKAGANSRKNNIIVFFIDDEFICILKNGIFYWKDGETYFKIKDIMRSLYNENKEINLCDLNEEISDTYKEDDIDELGIGTHGYYNGNEFRIKKIYIDEDYDNTEENYIMTEFIETKICKVFYNKDINKLDFCYNLKRRKR